MALMVTALPVQKTKICQVEVSELFNRAAKQFGCILIIDIITSNPTWFFLPCQCVSSYLESIWAFQWGCTAMKGKELWYTIHDLEITRKTKKKKKRYPFTSSTSPGFKLAKCWLIFPWGYTYKIHERNHNLCKTYHTSLKKKLSSKG